MNVLPEDPQLAEVLDQYLERLHAGEPTDRAALLDRYPVLAPLLDCLDALDSLLPSTAAPSAVVTETFPRQFGPYELLSEIGRGGMGVVYLAHQRGLERLVAVKMILSANLASAEHVRRFQAEARAAARVSHPHIVPIHEVGQLHGQHYFSMEYVAGESLAQRVAQGSLDLDAAVRLMVDVARAVAHLHSQGIVHRDLKPSNILVDAEGHAYVSDFGLAKVFAAGSDATATGVIAGTPSYMSPEQASAQGAAIGPASDVYGLGAVLYELLTGAPPFVADSPLDTLLQVLGREPVPPRRLDPRIPRDLETLCLKCLNKAPAERYPSAAALADDLQRFLAGEPITVRPPHLGERLWRWFRRRPALASHLGALGLFYLAELAHFGLGLVDLTFHLKVTLIAALWAAGSIVCQSFLDRGRWTLVADFAWGTLDAVLLLAMLLVGNGAASALVVGYPLLIVGSGLWFRVRFVWYMTGLSLVSYGWLVLDYYLRRTDLHAVMQPQADRHVIFAVSLVVLGGMVSYLVERVRALNRFYGRAVDR